MQQKELNNTRKYKAFEITLTKEYTTYRRQYKPKAHCLLQSLVQAMYTTKKNYSYDPNHNP